MKKRKESESEKQRYTHLNAEFQRIARRDKKAFLNEQCKEIEENNKIRKTSDLFNRKYLGNISRESDGTPLQYSCLENPMVGGAW